MPTSQPNSPPPSPTSVPSPTPPASIARYIGHNVVEGETIAVLVQRGGSSADLIKRYNRLTREPQPGRELIIPQLDGQNSEYRSEKLMVTHGHTDKPWIAWTFDCGGKNAGGPKILDALRTLNITTTFFILGDSIIENPAVLRQMCIGQMPFAHSAWFQTRRSVPEQRLFLPPFDDRDDEVPVQHLFDYYSIAPNGGRWSRNRSSFLHPSLVSHAHARRNVG